MTLAPDPHLRLGASLYVPATHAELPAIAGGSKIPNLRSLILCTEDAVRHDQLETALRAIEALLPTLRPSPMLRFIRVRNAHVLGRLLEADGIGAIDGFVIPKATAESLPAYLGLLTGRDPFTLMPTLETAEAYDPEEMRALRRLLSTDRVRGRILALRIGGNDLLQAIGVRRSPLRTIYETPVGQVISSLVGIFKPYGFHLTAPVFEGLEHPEVLAREVATDLDHGLFGKTAVHPTQIPQIERLYRVDARDLEAARAILDETSPAVFRMHGAMCEPATHRGWAARIDACAALYGVEGAAGPASAPLFAVA